MKFLVVLCLVAATAQAIDVNWTTIKAVDIFPEDIEIILENTPCYETPEPSDTFGAQPAGLGQFPWQVGVIVQTKGGETGFCGGSILNDEWILTAAHCVESPDSIRVLFAAQNLVDSNPEQYTRTVSWFRQNSDYDPYFVQADLALLKLDEPITFNDYVRPIRLPREPVDIKNEFAGSIGIVSGWGSDTPGDTTVYPVLRSYQNTILSWSECNAQWPRYTELAQVCLSSDNGRSTYKADSGSPLVVKEADGEYTQVGVLSYGSPSPCHSGLPVVYARVSMFLAWFNWIINDGPIPLPYPQQ